uniref:Peptidase S1 domain-containing protein n=1 Tax=Callorhinchus milii TaxID=7868 RepID=A0A4W3GTD6_CALMI
MRSVIKLQRLGLSFALNNVVEPEDAVPHSWPWQVSLGLASEHVCGGSALSKRSVARLIIGPCVCREQFINLWTESFIKQILIHPRYNSTTQDYDVALIQLQKPLQYNDYVRPACLPEATQDLELPSLCVVTGWGQLYKGTSQLQVPVLGSVQCHEYYTSHPGGITGRMFCGGFPVEGREETCWGDVGGPLVCPFGSSGIYTLYGIASWGWGWGCGRADFPSVYTNVSAVVDWVSEWLQGKFLLFCKPHFIVKKNLPKGFTFSIFSGETLPYHICVLHFVHMPSFCVLVCPLHPPHLPPTHS